MNINHFGKPDSAGRDFPVARPTPYQTCKELSNYSRKLIYNNDTEILERLIGFISTIYRFSKNNSVRNAIENVFLYNISTDILLVANRKKLFNLLPPIFQKIIVSQISTSGI
jgi:hypothetical protein